MSDVIDNVVPHYPRDGETTFQLRDVLLNETGLLVKPGRTVFDYTDWPDIPVNINLCKELVVRPHTANQIASSILEGLGIADTANSADDSVEGWVGSGAAFSRPGETATLPTGQTHSTWGGYRFHSPHSIDRSPVGSLASKMGMLTVENKTSDKVNMPVDSSMVIKPNQTGTNLTIAGGFVDSEG